MPSPKATTHTPKEIKTNIMSYTNLIYHIVFSTYRRKPTIVEEHERELYAYINGFINNLDGKLYRVGGMPDHLHILVSIPPQISVSEFVRRIKFSTNSWLRRNQSFRNFEGWGQGYAAFSYSKEEIPIIRQYIIGQKEHHKNIAFENEYRDFITKNGAEIDERYFLKD